MRQWLCGWLVLVLAVAAAGQSIANLFRKPVKVPVINSASAWDYAPTLPRYGLVMYFTSNRTGGTGLQDIYMTTRPDLVTSWATPKELKSLNTTAGDYYIDVRDDDRELFISANRQGGTGNDDLWVSTRKYAWLPWGTPVELKSLNSALIEDDPSVTGDGLELYFTSGRQGGANIFRSTRLDLNDPWTTPVPVKELNSTAFDHSPAISPDGLTIIFSSTRSGGNGGSSDHWIATRPNRASTFSTPVPLNNINTQWWDHNGQWTADGFTFYYAYGPTTGNVPPDIYRADRILPLCLLHGEPVLGMTYQVSCRRDPGDVAVVAAALQKLPTPIPIPPLVGNLEINPAFIFFQAIGVVGTNGRFTLNLAIPNLPVLQGIDLYFQAAAQSGANIYLSNLAATKIRKWTQTASGERACDGNEATVLTLGPTPGTYRIHVAAKALVNNQETLSDCPVTFVFRYTASTHKGHEARTAVTLIPGDAESVLLPMLSGQGLNINVVSPAMTGKKLRYTVTVE